MPAPKPRSKRIEPTTLALALVGGSVLTGAAHGLSIGAPQFDSYLAQPLQVRIPVSDIEPGTPPEYYQIRALPAQQYGKLGLSAPEFELQDLKLRWVRDANGQAQIQISSRRAVSEPVLTLLLEVRGPRQRWVRQLDLLLDPPSRNVQASAPEADLAGDRADTRRPRSQASRPAQTPIQANSRSTSTENYGPVRRGEVLSLIAQRVRPDPAIPLGQMAQAIVDANPQAFANGPRSLAVGSMLRIPDRQTIERTANNPAFLQGTPPQRKTVSKPSRPSRNAIEKVPAFLPDRHYLNGYFYSLSTQFLSYEAIRPVDLQARLVSLEAAEPFRFKADWTLSTLPATRLKTVQQAPPIAVSPTAAPTPGSIQPPDPVALEDLEQARASASLTERAVAQDEATNLPGGNEAEQVAAIESAQTNTLAEAPEPVPASMAAPAQATATKTGSSGTVSDAGWTLWPWLLALLGGAGLWWWTRARWQRVDTSEPQATIPAGAAKPAAKESVAQPTSSREAIRIKRQLKPLLDSADEATARQAKVAQALFDRDRIEDAKRLIQELKDSAPAASPVTTAEPTPAETVAAETPPATVPANPSEFEQRRVLKLIRQQIKQGQDGETLRQLTVAEALCERGKTQRAQDILNQILAESGGEPLVQRPQSG